MTFSDKWRGFFGAVWRPVRNRPSSDRVLVERTQAGLSRAEGERLGRPASLTAEQRRSVLRRLEEGATVSALAREFGTSRQTILRVRSAAPAS